MSADSSPDLPAGRLRKVFDESHFVRDRKLLHLLPASPGRPRRLYVASFLAHYVGSDGLANQILWHTCHGSLLDSGDQEQDVLDLNGIDLLSRVLMISSLPLTDARRLSSRRPVVNTIGIDV